MCLADALVYYIHGIMASSPEQRCVFTLCAGEPLTAGLREVCGLGHAEPPQPSANASSEGKRVLE